MNLASAFDRGLANIWGQTEGTESHGDRGRLAADRHRPAAELGPQPSPPPARHPLPASDSPSASQINGIQAPESCPQMKHFAARRAEPEHRHRQIPDQARHEISTPDDIRVRQRPGSRPHVLRTRSGRTPTDAAVRHRHAHPAPPPVSRTRPPAENPQTWPLNESHHPCEQLLTLMDVLHDLWGSQVMVAPTTRDVRAPRAIFQGEAQEQPTTSGDFSDSNSLDHLSGFGGAAGQPRPDR